MKLVNIVMSIYNPDIKFLKKQIKSIDNQDYDNIELIIWDDNPDSTFPDSILNDMIKKHRHKYIKGSKNLGYAKAFEYLTEIAEGEYIAYCDQDDIWMENKISRCVEEIEKEDAVLVTADRAIIDENDCTIISSCRHQKKNVCNSWNTGDNITSLAVFNTCAIGMNIFMRTDIAKQILPLPKETAHDKWLTAGASIKGKVVFIDEVLVEYRRHGKNVSGILNGIKKKEDYYCDRVDYSYYLAKEFIQRFPELSKKDKEIIMKFANARKQKKIFQIYKYRHLSPDVAKFEILLKFIPAPFFSLGLIFFQKLKK